MPLVDCVCTVRPFDGSVEVASPISGARGLAVHLEVLDEGDASVGVTVLGDALSLESDDGAKYVVVVRRAIFGFVETRRSMPLDSAPAELVPILRRSRGGRLFVREHVVRDGDRLRLRAHVDEVCALRDDLAPVRIDEVL